MIDIDKLKEIRPDLTDEELALELRAKEEMIRRVTNNKFHDYRVRHRDLYVFADDKIIGNFEDTLLQAGDRIQVQKSILNEGLYNIIDINKNYIEVDGQMITHVGEGMITKVVYPADVITGVIGLFKFDKEFSTKSGIKSETISRYSVTYAESDGRSEGYPARQLEFLVKYRRIRW